MALLLSGRADASTVFYSTHFDNSTGWISDLLPANGVGGSIDTSTPFVVNGASMGSYMTATYYPTTLVTPANATAYPDVWLGFLLRATNSTWLGGVNLTGGTTNREVQYDGPWIGQVGSVNQPIIAIYKNDFVNKAPNFFSLTPGQTVAVLAHFYDKSYSMADLWVQPDLTRPLFTDISPATALVYGFATDNQNDTIRSLRLAGENGSQSYDNLIMASSSADVVNFLQTASVPEPSTYALFCIGLVGMGYAWKRMKKDEQKVREMQTGQ